jgi:hypothetical protein
VTDRDLGGQVTRERSPSLGRWSSVSGVIRHRTQAGIDTVAPLIATFILGFCLKGSDQACQDFLVKERGVHGT